MAPDDAHVGDGLTVLIQGLDSGDNIVQMLLGQAAAVDGETDHVGQLSLLLGSLQVILHGVVAQLGGTDTIAADQLQREALAGKGLVTALAVEELGHVDVHGMAAGGEHDALDTGLVEALSQVLALLHALVQIVEVAGLIQTHGQSHDVAAAHAAVGVVAVAGDLLHLQQNANVGLDGAVLVEVGEVLPEQALVAEGQHAAHVGVAVLLGGHGEAVAVGEHLGGDLGDGLILVAGLVHLDEVGVLGPTGGVQDVGDVVLVGDLRGGPQVSHGDGLAADGVVGDAGEHQGHILGTHGLDQLLQLLGVHVALERVLLIGAALGNLVQQGLVVQVAGHGAHLLDVALGGVEVAVGGNGEDLAGMTLGQDLLHDLHQDGLSGTALLDDEGVGALHLSGAAVEQAALILAEVDLVHHLLHVTAVGADQVDDLLPVLLAAALENVAEGVQQDIVAGVAAVSLVAQEQGGPLMVGHGGGAGVGQHVDGQHAGGESELVVVSGLQSALTLLNGNFGKVTDCKGEMMGGGNAQRILFRHNTLPPYSALGALIFLEIPRSSKGWIPRSSLAPSGQYHSQGLTGSLFWGTYFVAMTSISTRASLGRRATSTAEREG